ncbi:MAG: hypothetical protein JSW11_12585 [Candidatus Heimdallarchaeota archaeon]|nr:MAG: hypothetical protein JSW11_12585 [Candidatus Heimdallarchaeota archaeon]
MLLHSFSTRFIIKHISTKLFNLKQRGLYCQ